MSKNLSAKYYQENKELKKKLLKDKIFLQKKKKKAAIWSWRLPLKGWKTKACWVDKKC